MKLDNKILSKMSISKISSESIPSTPNSSPSSKGDDRAAARPHPKIPLLDVDKLAAINDRLDSEEYGKQEVSSGSKQKPRDEMSMLKSQFNIFKKVNPVSTNSNTKHP